MRLVTSVEEKLWSLQSSQRADSSCCGCILLLPHFLLSQDPFLPPGIASFTHHSPVTHLWFFWSFKIQQQLHCEGGLPPLNLLLHCVNFPFPFSWAVKTQTVYTILFYSANSGLSGAHSVLKQYFNEGYKAQKEEIDRYTTSTSSTQYRNTLAENRRKWPREWKHCSQMFKWKSLPWWYKEPSQQQSIRTAGSKAGAQEAGFAARVLSLLQHSLCTLNSWWSNRVW